MAENQIQDVNWWHESLIDWLVANPDRRLYECAAYFNKTQAWISTILHSDVFKARYAQRLEGHRDLLSRSIIGQVEGVARLALNELERRLEDERTTLTYGQMLETAEATAKLLGYGAKSQGAIIQAQVININRVDANVLQRARDKAQLVEQQHLAMPHLQQGESTTEVDNATRDGELLPAQA